MQQDVCVWLLLLHLYVSVRMQNCNRHRQRNAIALEPRPVNILLDDSCIAATNLASLVVSRVKQAGLVNACCMLSLIPSVSVMQRKGAYVMGQG